MLLAEAEGVAGKIEQYVPIAEHIKHVHGIVFFVVVVVVNFCFAFAFADFEPSVGVDKRRIFAAERLDIFIGYVLTAGGELIGGTLYECMLNAGIEEIIVNIAVDHHLNIVAAAEGEDVEECLFRFQRGGMFVAFRCVEIQCNHFFIAAEFHFEVFEEIDSEH